MVKPNSVTLFGFLVVILGVMGGLALLKGGLLIAGHEGDTLHSVEIVFRMNAGEWPHLDFMTPIGALAYAPIAFFVALGVAVGHAILYAQIAVAAVLLPAVWWGGISRMRGALPYLFGAVVIVLTTALISGLTDPVISISMHYNRWAWAISFVAIALALLPALERTRPMIDGGIIGICMAMLVLIKVTYFIAFAPAIIAGLMLRKSYRTLVVAVTVGLLIAGIVTLFAGIAFWQAYVGDLLQVARSDVRPQPGFGFGALIMDPAYLAGTIVAALGFLLLRQSGEKAGGAALALLVPGFYYVTFQNFGNDPQWLMLLAILLFAMRPDAGPINRWGWDLRGALNVTAIAALVLTVPSFINLASSPYRHLGLNSARYEPILPGAELHSDLQAVTVRIRRVDARVAMDGPGSGLEHFSEGAMRGDTGTLLGELLPNCKLMLGLPGWTDAIVQDVAKAGLAKGKRLFIADKLSSHWLFGEFERLPHGAPWYYGGLPGFESADYVLVPLCATDPKARKQVLDTIAARTDVTLSEIRRTPLYILLSIDRQS